MIHYKLMKDLLVMFAYLAVLSTGLWRLLNCQAKDIYHMSIQPDGRALSNVKSDESVGPP